MFVARGMVNYKPMLSTTYIVANYQLAPNLQSGGCKGGQPADVFKSIAKSGTASNHCIDYYWCKDNPSCNPQKSDGGKGGKEFHQVKNLNTLIPPKGCFFPENKKLYYVADVQVASADKPSDTKHFQLEMKHHLMRYGPISAGYIVLDNFVTGNYSATGNVYFDNIDYNNSAPGKLKLANNPKVLGGHAVAVVGWGETDAPIEYAPGKKAVIPYWLVRNSWGDTWGTDKGYFKIAMFPYNEKVGFDHTLDMGKGQKIGGFITSKASKIVDGAIKNTVPVKFMPPDEKAFFQAENKGHEIDGKKSGPDGKGHADDHDGDDVHDSMDGRGKDHGITYTSLVILLNIFAIVFFGWLCIRMFLK